MNYKNQINLGVIITLSFFIFQCTPKFNPPVVEVQKFKLHSLKKGKITLDINLNILNNNKKDIKIKEFYASVVYNKAIVAQTLETNTIILPAGTKIKYKSHVDVESKFLFKTFASLILNKEIEILINGYVDFKHFLGSYRYDFTEPVNIDMMKLFK